MKIFVSGATGLIGSSLSVDLAAAGHTVYRLVRDRRAAVGGNVYWTRPPANSMRRHWPMRTQS